MTQEPEKQDATSLAQRCSEVFEGAGEAIDWVAETSSRLSDEAPTLTDMLRRVRNQVRRLGIAATRPMTVGLFGLSQAGKSYLLSALAADDKGRLEIEFEGERLDFVKQVNPPGGGSEATGLVTRFTHRPLKDEAPEGFPIQLTLLSEAELIKVLANSSFNDFDKEKKVPGPVYDDGVRDMLRDFEKHFEKRPKGKPVPGMSADDVVDLYDYLEANFTSSMDSLFKADKAEYWRCAVDLAPYLKPSDRARLFAILWRNLDEFTETYLRLRKALEKLSFAEVVYAPLNALVKDTGAGKVRSEKSIIAVATLNRLDSPSDDYLQIRPWLADAPGQDVSVSRAELTALTAEIAFPLVNNPKVEVFNALDVLDFPGYRSRLKLTSTKLDEVRAQTNEADPMAELVLRGKVAYLFERYTDNQEMNILILCTPSDQQSEVTDVVPVLSDWITKTQGATAEQRADHPSGLVWAITKFDEVLEKVSHEDSLDTMRPHWGNQGLMKRTLLERFGKCDWISDWHPNQPFNRVFLVRKPNMGIFVENGKTEEKNLNEDKHYQPKFKQARQTFIEDETVKRHIDKPQEAWDAMMQLDDGGITRLGNYLKEVTNVWNDRGIKLKRITEQLAEAVKEIRAGLGRYYQEGGEEGVKKKKEIAERVIKAIEEIWDRHLQKGRHSLIGELLARLEPSADDLRERYRADSDASHEDSGAASTPEEKADPSQASAKPSADRQLRLRSTEGRFAQAVMEEWRKHLREIPKNEALLRYLGYGKQTIEDLVDELIAGAERCQLEGRLVKETQSAERYASARRDSLVARQVAAVRTVINDYIAWLGNERIPLEERPPSSAGASGHKLFAPPPAIPKGKLPELDEQYRDYTSIYLHDWLAALEQLIIGNAGFSDPGGITVEQNMALGIILSKIGGSQAASQSAATPAPGGQT